MTLLQTYGDRSGPADPYAAFGARASRSRSGRSALGLRLDNFENATLSPLAVDVIAGLANGSLSSIKIFISHSRTEHLQGLPEMLRSLESMRAKADPYVEISETIRFPVGKSFGQRLAKVLEVAATRQPKRKASLEEFLEPVLRLENHGRVDSALDALYDRVDDLLRSGEFETLDAMFQQAKGGSLSTNVLLGLLTATLPARSKLPARVKFFAEAEASIKARDEWEVGLLAGLES